MSIKSQFKFYFILISIFLGENNLIQANYNSPINETSFFQDKNPDIKIMLENIAKLTEIRQLQISITKSNNESKGVSYIVDPETYYTKNKNCYRVKAGINGKYRWEGIYIFYVNTKNLNDILIEDTVSGEIVSISDWRKRNKEVRKSSLNKKDFKISDVDGYTNLRKEKNAKSEIITKINTGTIIKVIDDTGDWWYIQTKDGKKGYVHKSRIVSE